MINNRQNGRRRGRGNNNGGGNGQRSGNPGRPDSGNRIDSRARGNANQLYEKYKNLARDSQMSGDRVNTEYYLQFADHYFRVLNETRTRFEEQNPNAAPQRRIQPVDSFDDFDGDDEFGDEGEPIRAGEQGGQRDGHREQGARDQNGRDQNNRDQNGRDQNGRDQYLRDQNGRDQGRQQGQRDDTRRDEGRYDRQEAARRDDARPQPQQDRYEGQGGLRQAGQQGGERPPRQDRDDRPAIAASPVGNDPGEDSPAGNEPGPTQVAPRRRGRPPRAAAVEASEAPAALDADRLPPSLSLAAAPVAAADGDDAPKPRRRRVRTAAGDAPQAG